MTEILRQPERGEQLEVEPLETVRFPNAKGTGFIKWTANRTRRVRPGDDFTYRKCCELAQEGRLRFTRIVPSAEKQAGGTGNGKTED